MKKTVLVLIMIISVYLIIGYASDKYDLIPKEAIRLRVLANSNSDYDQEIKNKVSIQLQNEMYSLLKNTKGIDEARTIINNNLDHLNNSVGNLLNKENYGLDYQFDFSYHYFPIKNYKGLTYDEGYYESILVQLGDGNGDNWWCVLFPPLCLLEATESSEVEYKFFIKEILDKYL